MTRALTWRERALMEAVLDAERFDRQFGLNLPGDSALAVVLGGFEERLATDPGTNSPRLPRNRGKVAAVDGPTTTGAGDDG